MFRKDEIALNSAHKEIRSHFEANRLVQDDEILRGLFKDISEVEEMMQQNFVQATLNPKGNYEVELKSSNDPNSTCPPKFEPVTPELVSTIESNLKK